MGRISSLVTIENSSEVEKRIECDALVDNGASEYWKDIENTYNEVEIDKGPTSTHFFLI